MKMKVRGRKKREGRGGGEKEEVRRKVGHGEEEDVKKEIGRRVGNREEEGKRKKRLEGEEN